MTKNECNTSHSCARMCRWVISKITQNQRECHLQLSLVAGRWSLVARRCTHARVMVIIVCIWCIFASRIVNAFDEVVHLQAASELIHAYAIIVVIAMAKWQNGKTKTKTKNKSHHINVNSNLFAFALVKIFQRMSWVVKSFRINTDTPTIIYKRILRISKI